MTAVPPVPTHLTAVVSTIGRPEDLRGLVRSLEESRDPGRVSLVVVDQSDDRRCLRMLEDVPPRIPYAGTTSARGVSLGRNVGARLATGDVLGFPDDNCWFAPDVVDRVLTAFRERPDLGVVTGIQRTSDGAPSMLRWQEHAGPVHRENLDHVAIESSTFYRRDRFEAVGGFDERIGLGSAGPYQAGEGTDLLLRMLEAGDPMWYDPAIVVVQDDPRTDPPPGFSHRMRGYGRGFGLLNRRHHLPARGLVRAVGRKIAAAGVRGVSGRRAQASADLAWAVGVVEGATGRLVPSGRRLPGALR